MVSPIIPSLVFFAWLIIHWVWQIHTHFFQKHYFAGVFAFIATATISAGLAYLWIVDLTLFSPILATVFSIISIFFIGLFVAKLTIAPDTQYLKLKFLFRGLTFYEPSYIDFSVTREDKDNAWTRTQRNLVNFEIETTDNIKIRGVRISSGHPNVIIVAHGAMRSKNTFPYVAIAQWLAYKYDVISFDFRGHGESEGYHNFSDAPIQDLRAVVQYARRLGYKKVGVFGRSMGGWVALLEAAQYHDVDSIVAAASPLQQITDIKGAQLSRRIIQTPFLGISASLIAQMIIKIFRGTRMDGIKDAQKCPIDVVDQIAPIPVFLIYQEYDTVIHTSVQDAYKIFEALKGTKELLILAGPGHIFELPQFHRVFSSIEFWFDRTLGEK